MSERPASFAARRFESIDVLRAGAILLMVQIHFAQNLAADLDADRLVSYLSRALGMLPAPLFTFVAGVSLRVSLSRRAAGAAAEALALRHIRRGLLLFFAGLMFATLVRMPDRVFAWDILPFIGASVLLLFAARRLPDRAIALAAVLVAAASPALRALSGYAAHWPAGDVYEYAFTLRDVAWGFVANGYFPLFPWLVFPLAGFASARVFADDPAAAAAARRAVPVAGVALLALAAALSRDGAAADALWFGHAGAVRFYPATTPFLLKALGLILVAFAALHAWLDRRAGASLPLRSFLCLQSRYSLTTYVVHHLVLIWPLTLAAFLEGRPGPSHAPAALMSTGAALALAGVFVALFSIVLAAWDRRGGRHSFEWLLGKLAG